ASVGAYGSARPTTPNFDAVMARAGTLFEQAIAPFPHTLPSHMSLFTSLYERTHGVRGLFTKLADDRPTLPQLMARRGYTTARLTEAGFLSAGAGFARGFSVYAENKSADLHEPDGQVQVTFGRAKAWLDRHGDEPFFLFVHTYQVHYPYAPPPAYRSYFENIDKISVESERQRLLYEQEVRFTDDQLRDLLDHLRHLGLE